MKKILLISVLTLNLVKGYSQIANPEALLNKEVLEKVKSMMAADEGLVDIEDFYKKISNEPQVKTLIKSYYAKPLINTELAVKQISRIKITPENLLAPAEEFIPARAFIDSIPNPFFDPVVKRFNYEKEHAEFHYLYRDFTEAIGQKMTELGTPSYHPGGSAGSKIVEQLDVRFNFYKMELSQYRQDMIESSRNAQNEIVNWSAKSDHYAGSEEERRAAVSREASAYRISRAILIRMCDELEFGVNLSYFKARKTALGNMAVQAAKLYQDKSTVKGKNVTVEILEISKALFDKVNLMLFDGSLLQTKAQIINYNFDTLIDMSRL